jgi:hypothetical protein
LKTRSYLADGRLYWRVTAEIMAHGSQPVKLVSKGLVTIGKQQHVLIYSAFFCLRFPF